jgi:transketolase
MTSESIALAAPPNVSHAERANAIRALAMDAVQQANSGHPGMPMGIADVATVLFTEFLNICPAHPDWPDRDRFVLSAGHGSMLQYALHYLLGYDDMTIEQIKHFRQLGAITAGHPEYGHALGIETTTGPLGQGIANAVGMALAERMLAAQFSEDITNHYTYVIAGDGCLMEGISHEAASLAGHLKLRKLIVLYDDNDISIDGPTDLTLSDDALARFEAYGWDAERIDGHDPDAIRAAITRAQASEKPSLIACKTVIGKGAPTKAGTAATHGAPLGDEEVTGARTALNWPHAPFDIPADILASWRAAGRRSTPAFEAWQERFASADADTQAAFIARIEGDLGEEWNEALQALKRSIAETQPKEATRKSSQNTLEALTPAIDALVGGSADLTGSNNTKTAVTEPVSAANRYAGRYIYYGVREHAMAAAMNGISLHGGFVPYGGTFLVFTDYCRASIRLSALMKQRVIYVMTHDSIGLGEDGPTHQPVEHVASLRAMPNVNMFRPADATETAECWALALAAETTPSVLALSRQAVPSLRHGYTTQNLCAMGGYVLHENGDANAVTLIGTGTELSLCVQAHDALQAKGIASRVVSMPCWELFEKQPADYRAKVLGSGKRIAIEAGVRFGWDRFLRDGDVFIGMDGFGASAPAPELYKHFGITAEAIIKAAS